MPVYQISAVGDDGVKVLATTDTATDALAKFKAALEDYRRVWVSDETGADVQMIELVALAQREHPDD